jgi:perosamine synthetase
VNSTAKLNVPFFRPDIGDDEVNEVIASLKSGWLTTGPRVKAFQGGFVQATGGKHALALNSCTAALHLALEALNLKAGEGVLVPTMTFAASAEVVRYLGAIPILVDCDASLAHLDLDDAARKLADLRAGRLPPTIPVDTRVVGIIPVHVAGVMMDMDAVKAFAQEHGLWVVEDAAHSFPAAWRKDASSSWQRCGENTSHITCFSFYANKTITTGEGGMAVTDDDALFARMKLMALHGLSHDAWDRYSGGRAWDYRIVAPGFKYNMTDAAGALGVVQLRRAESLRVERERLALHYRATLADVDAIELPPVVENRVHAWHLFPIQLRTEMLTIDRNAFVDALKDAGVGCSVHWRPLHMHPYYEQTYGFTPESLPVATRRFERTLTLPLFPGIRDDEVAHVLDTVRDVCVRHRR